jgi:LysM repeat protein
VPTQEGTITPVPTAVGTPIPPQPTATPQLPGDFNSTVLYTVQAGDTVWDIARRYNSTVAAITQVNGLNNSGLINIGQVLVVPVRIDYTQPPTFTPAPTQAGGGTGGPITPAGNTYTVRGGDTLFAISLRYNTTVATMAQLNNIVNPNLIFPGQTLRVPGAAPAPAPAPTATPVYMPAPTATPVYAPVPQPRPGTHVVQTGENLFRIALRYNLTWDVLARANGIFNPNLIFPGQVLRIP